MSQSASYKFGKLLGSLPIWAKFILSTVIAIPVGFCSFSTEKQDNPANSISAPNQVSVQQELPASNPTHSYDDLLKNALVDINASEKFLKDTESHLIKFYASKQQLLDAKYFLSKLSAIISSYEASRESNETGLVKRARAIYPKIDNITRKIFASSLEENFLKNGLDISVTAVNESHKTLRIKYSLMSQPLVYKFQNDLDLERMAKEVKFTKIIYTNGFQSSLGKTWTVDF